MNGRAFLVVANEVISGSTEAHWRAASELAYYALLQEALAALEQWGFPRPPHTQIHAYVRQRFSFPQDFDVKKIGYAIEELGLLRNHAHYQLNRPGKFATSTEAARTITKAEERIDLLDEVDGDPARRAAAISSIRAAFP